MYTRAHCLFALVAFTASSCGSPEPATDIDAAREPGARVTGERSGAGESDAASLDQSIEEDAHLTGWWKFDEVSGTVATDSSRHRRSGALLGGLSFEESSVHGRCDGALRFEGSEAKYVEIPGCVGVGGTRARTVAAWIRTSQPRGEIVSWGREEGGRMWIVGFIRSGFGVTPRGGYLYSNSRVHDGDWHHVAAVVEDAAAPNLHDHVLLYKDGVRAEIDDIGLLDLWPIDTGSDLNVRIGRRFNGDLDEVRIYDRALSPDEIELLFHSIPTASGVASDLRRLDQRARKLLKHGKSP